MFQFVCGIVTCVSIVKALDEELPDGLVELVATVRAAWSVGLLDAEKVGVQPMCPVRSCRMTLDCAQVSASQLVMNLLDGIEESTWSIRRYLGDEVQSFAHCSLILPKYVCLVADALFGRGAAFAVS